MQTIDLAKLRNGEFIKFLKNVRDAVSQKGPAALQVQEQYDVLASSITVLDNLFKVAQGNVISDELLALDQRRDSAILGINAMVTAYTYGTDPATRAAAQLLANNLAVYGAGNMTRDSYQSETQSIEALLKDWSTKPELVAAVNTLPLAGFIAELATANTQFDTRYMDRAEEMGVASPDTLRAKRFEANTAYYELRDYLNWYFKVNKAVEPYAGRRSGPSEWAGYQL